MNQPSSLYHHSPTKKATFNQHYISKPMSFNENLDRTEKYDHDQLFQKDVKVNHGMSLHHVSPVKDMVLHDVSQRIKVEKPL